MCGVSVLGWLLWEQMFVVMRCVGKVCVYIFFFQAEDGIRDRDG